MSTTKLLNPSEAISKLNISYSTLLRKVKNKEIPCIRIGKQIRFPLSYFEDLEIQAFDSVKGGRV